MNSGITPVRLVALVVIIAALAFGGYLLLQPRPPLNVILISIDTLRPDRMGVYGHRPMGLSTTPSLDALAARGAVFENAVSTTSWTLPAHYSLLTGVPDRFHGMIDDRCTPPDDMPMLASLLKDAGYATGGFVSGLYLGTLFGFGTGFDEYEPCMDMDKLIARHKKKAASTTIENRGQGLPATHLPAHELVTSREVTNRGFRFIRENKDKTFFLFLHYFDVHHDFVPPAPFDTRFGPPYDGWVNGRGVTKDPRYNADMDPKDKERLMVLYDGEIGWVDDNIGRLLKNIRNFTPEILENTLIIVTSDHGDEFFEHGQVGHRRNLYESVVRVPLIVSCPGRIDEGVRIDETARIYDIVPTILDLTGLETPPVVMGTSLLPLMGEDESEARPALLELTGGFEETSCKKHKALVLGDWKLISVEEREWSEKDPLDFTGSILSEKHELFNIKDDPSEQKNLSAHEADILKKMLSTRQNLFTELDEAIRLFRTSDSRNEVRRIPDNIRKGLDDLGYGGGR